MPSPRNGCCPLAVGEPEPGVDSGQFCGCSSGNRSDRIRGSFEGRIVTDDDDAVRGEVDVELEAIGTGAETEIEGSNGVLRTKGAAAAMGKHAWRSLPKERHNA